MRYSCPACKEGVRFLAQRCPHCTTCLGWKSAFKTPAWGMALLRAALEICGVAIILIALITAARTFPTLPLTWYAQKSPEIFVGTALFLLAVELLRPQPYKK